MSLPSWIPVRLAWALALVTSFCIMGRAEADDDELSFEVYGFGQADYIQDFDRVDPSWAATLRPSRIPTEDGQYGSDGEALVSARQSRFGVKGNLPSPAGNVRTMFEFDLFGVGIDEGQTTIRLRHAYGEFGNWLGGQTHSLFMDIDIFPNVIDYWGPSGMVFLRTPQLRWQPVRGTHNLAVAIEYPDEAIDVGVFDRIIDAQDLDVRGVTRAPDITGRYRLEHDRGHLQVAGILRSIGFETIGTPDSRPRDNFTAWGVNLSSVTHFHDQGRLRLAFVFGEGIASYMNDGGVDLAPSAIAIPAPVETVPLRGYTAYYDFFWTEQWSSAVGYSALEFDTLDGQRGGAYKQGQYASANLLHYPTERVMYGIEALWGAREDKDGASGRDRRFQISFKYSF